MTRIGLVMIKYNEFNSKWWGEPVGFINDPNFFSLAKDKQDAMLTPFSWAEFKAPLSSSLPLVDIHRAGFIYVDTQVPFSIDLSKLESTDGSGSFVVRFGDESPFAVSLDEIASFTHERFVYLPDVAQSKVDERYAVWANQLIKENPSWCLQVLYQDIIQGWFLSRDEKSGLHLTLNMLHRHARISGRQFYQAALEAYQKRGVGIGYAAFSITNMAVLNIYAPLGARFLTPEGCWLWRRQWSDCSRQ